MNKWRIACFHQGQEQASYDRQFGIMVNSRGGLCLLGYAYPNMRLEPQ